MKIRTGIQDNNFLVAQAAFAVLVYIGNYQAGLDMARFFNS